MAPNDSLQSQQSSNHSNGESCINEKANHYRRNDQSVSDGDEIVISGISGRFPNSKNIAEFEENLYNKIDMVTEKSRWPYFSIEIPKRFGTLLDLEYFDAAFFGVTDKQANAMDPQIRFLHEITVEAIIDAGINPNSLKGTNTGIYVGICFSESQSNLLYGGDIPSGMGLLGCLRTMAPNRISNYLGTTGPAYIVDTACSSSMFALDNAFTALRNGTIDAAIVAGLNLVLHPNIVLQFTQLGIVALDGYCRPFDENASGYTRSEATPCIFLQRKRNAKRVYASVLYSKTNCDGYKEQGITFPSSDLQEKLLRDFYNETNIDKNEIGYVEAHSTGTIVGDPEECRAICNVMCDDRTEPLLVGSVKSNIGHSEAASALCSIAKVVLAFERGAIAPNINFTEVRKTIPSLVDGHLKVVSEITPLEKPLIAVNAFGFGGANAHVVLKQHSKEKITADAQFFGELPRLVLWSSRTEFGADKMLANLESRPFDTEYIGLMEDIQTEKIAGFFYRSFGVYAPHSIANAHCLIKDVRFNIGEKLPTIWIFPGFRNGFVQETEWTDMLKISSFRDSIVKSDSILRSCGVDLYKLLTTHFAEVNSNILNTIVVSVALQIAFVDTLRLLEFEPNYFIGHSFGELSAAYADRTLTAEQAILAANALGQAAIESKTVGGLMINVQLAYHKLIELLPLTVKVAYRNSPESCTISGPADDVEKFSAYLRVQGIKTEVVNSGGIAFNTNYATKIGALFLQRMLQIIPAANKRSPRWLSTSIPRSLWDRPESQMASPEYFTNSILSPVLLENVFLPIHQKSISVEIAPVSTLERALPKVLPFGYHIQLASRERRNSLIFFLEALGRLYLHGVDLAVRNLYPPVKYPVSRGTPSISPYLEWNHVHGYHVTSLLNSTSKVDDTSFKRLFRITMHDEANLKGHCIDGRVLVPATYYIFMVWETFMPMRTGRFADNASIEFEDVRFLRATPLVDRNVVELSVSIQPGTGKFEINDKDSLVASGIVRPTIDIRPVAPQKIECDLPILQNRDFYKELRLRGYHYKDAFRSVQEARSDGLYGKIRWDVNWVSFLDCMMQMMIIGRDSRSLMLPTRIQKLTINGEHHLEVGRKCDPKNKLIEVFADKHENRMVSGGVEIMGMHATSVERRKAPGVPVLERYQFIPNYPINTLTKIDAARYCVQLALENIPTRITKAVEVDLTAKEPIISFFREAIEDLPLCTSDLKYLTTRKIEIDGVKLDNSPLRDNKGCKFIISEGILERRDFLEEVNNSLTETGYLVSRESLELDVNDFEAQPGFNLIAAIRTDDEMLILLQKVIKRNTESTTVVKISQDEELSWLNDLQNALSVGSSVVLISQNDKMNGILGLVNCLRKEPNGKTTITCVFIDDPNAPAFDLEDPFYKTQLQLGQAINVFRDGKWGTYRHLLLQQEVDPKPQKGHVFATMGQRGDLSSWMWVQGPLKIADTTVNLMFSSLNFRDVMLSTGRLPIEALELTRLDQHCITGFEFAGVDQNGRRLMGMIASGALSSQISSKDALIIDVPDNWTMQEAATIPVVYLTIYYAFFVTSDIRRGKSILIHSGTGGIGLAGIRVALSYGLEVFTTVGTAEKKKLLMEIYPEIKEENIGNSRNITFEEMIRLRTKGKGVDFVLNSLSEDKLLASVKCLGHGGTFLEIGKFDMANDNKLGLGQFAKGITFHAIFADHLFNYSKQYVDTVVDLIKQDIAAGVVKPLPVTIFPANEVEQALRFMATGKHTGKVLIEIREAPESEVTHPLVVYPRLYFDANLIWVIPGGLGGFGLELVDWMVIRGARKFILSSSHGITKAYQSYRIKIWESYGATIIVNTEDITTIEGCENLILEANKVAPVGGIFNLAVALRDGIFTNQTVEKFAESLAPKAKATRYLDEISRSLCPKLEHFIVFSSVSCGRGNAGQTNYGMANSIMERIMEDRVANGFPGKAIQWGAVGEVGIVADMAEDKIDMEIGGTLQQRISSCLQELDKLLNSPDPIVASMLVAEKHFGRGGKRNIFETVLNIIGIRDLKSFSMNTTLSGAGLDSLMTVEIKQTLEREFEVMLSLEEVRALTFQSLQELSDSKEREGCGDDVLAEEAPKKSNVGIGLVWRNFGAEENSAKLIVALDKKPEHTQGVTLIVPGIEGTAGSSWLEHCVELDTPAHVLQTFNNGRIRVAELIDDVYEDIRKEVFINTNTYYIIAYSYGVIAALAIAKKLEIDGLRGHILVIDGAPKFLKTIFHHRTSGGTASEADVENMVVATVVEHLFKDKITPEETFGLFQMADWNTKLQKMAELVKEVPNYSLEYCNKIINASLNCFRTLASDCEVEPIEAGITLVRPTEASVVNIEDDYGLSHYTENGVEVKFIEGNHATILDHPTLFEIINENDPFKKLLNK